MSAPLIWFLLTITQNGMVSNSIGENAARFTALVQAALARTAQAADAAKF